ncbi:NUDIX domain-containing protein [Geomicrobium sp. JCM 19038]|uniref:NUDIX domain-containing protein n=1 Tax=Geomicrobium sp. JCM 19038 TaxID=1460635 RepID=UPI00045F2F3D|nr:NUDIX hydrolase [Geomicrobium sp. JCM 19038]GAK06580.1 ADP-ribose pyrophosphatase [Geomicrobium sp. JCM 19038]
MDLTEKTVKKETVFEGKVITLELHDVTLPDKSSGKREVIKHPGAVAVLAVTPEGTIPLIRQYRKASEQTLLEIPAGKKEAGEEPLETAKRELKEETGFSAEHFVDIGGFYTSPGFADEYIHIYLAENVSTGEANTDEDEFLEIEMWSKEEAIQFALKGKFNDAKTAYSLLQLFARQNLADKS